jgi:hypothetical protein
MMGHWKLSNPTVDGGAVSFDEILGIVEARYTDQDLITINPDVEPFGVNALRTVPM